MAVSQASRSTHRARRVLAATATVSALALVAAGCGSGGDDDTGNATATELAALRSAVESGGTGAENPAISVRAMGRAESKPDLMTVSMGVEVNAETANDALDQSSILATALINTFKEQGVDEKDLKTSDLSIWPNWDRDGKHIVGYHVSNTLTVKLRDLDHAGAVIDVAAGSVGDAVRMNGVSFSIDDTTAALAKARADAVKKAADQAQQLAAAAGVELGRLRSVDETGGTTTPPVTYSAEMYRAQATDQSIAVPIEEGTQELTVEVVLVYDIAG